jgi:hypothetical protein
VLPELKIIVPLTLELSSCQGNRLNPGAACAVPGDSVYGFPRSLAHTIEPRAPIRKLGFTEG